MLFFIHGRTGQSEAIERSGNKKDRKKLEKIGEYPVAGTFDVKVYQKMGKVRNLQAKYHLAAKFDKSMIKLFRESPITGMKDIFPFLTSMMVNMQVMKELMSFDLRSKGVEYLMPVYYVLGENDQQTPVEISSAYFDDISARQKNYITSKTQATRQ